MSKALSLDSGSIPSFRDGLLVRLEGYISSRDTGEQLRTKLQKLELAVDILSKSVSPHAIVVVDTIGFLVSGWEKLDPQGKEAARWKIALQQHKR